MNETPGPDATAAGDAAAGAERDLARVQGKVDAARAVLLRLLQEVVVAERRLDTNQAAWMLEANEQLVLSALRDQAEVIDVKRGLSDAPRVAEIDPLTRLPTRALMLDRLAQAMATARRRAGRLALLFLDLDEFKPINDQLGHVAGDEALRQVALRLSRCVREADTVSRHGGDEFLVLLTDVSQAADAAVIAGKLLAALGEPLLLGDQVLHLTASIGISIYPDDGDSVEALIAHADAAMYRAKAQGPGRIDLPGDGAPQQPVSPRPGLQGAHEQALAAHERRHAQLREANEQLVLAALGAQELQAAAERAHQRQADFLVAVVEELGNPFAPIRVAAAMLGRAAGDEVLLPHVQAMVEQQRAHISRLVEAAGTRSRTLGTLQPAGQRVASDIAAVIDAAVRDARPVMELRQQHLTVVVPAGPVTVRGDAERLGHVLGNLLDNASKYSSDHGSIRLDVVVQGASVVLGVTDDGIGIAPDVALHIFEPFGQDSRAIGIHGTSTGIGLPVVKALVSELGGTVAVDSAGIGRGSRFVVTLPLAEAGDGGA